MENTTREFRVTFLNVDNGARYFKTFKEAVDYVRKVGFEATIYCVKTVHSHTLAHTYSPLNGEYFYGEYALKALDNPQDFK